MSEEQKEETTPPEFTDVLDNKEILKKVLIAGDNEIRPTRGDRCIINLTTKLKESGKVIESECYENHEVFVGDYDLFHAMDLVLPLMFIGETCQVYIAPRFVYGTAGKEPEIKGDDHLECIVKLISADNIGPESELPYEERIRLGTKKKERGNFWFNREEHSKAIHCYKQAVVYLDESPPEDGEVNSVLIEEIGKLKAIVHNNLAAAYMKRDQLESALKSIDDSLRLNEKSVKALYRKATILQMKKEYEEALSCVKSALKLEPGSETMKAKLVQLKTLADEQREKERQLFKKMLEINDDKKSGKEKNISDSDKSNHNNWMRKIFDKKAIIALTVTVVAISYAVFL